ncbi:MAG: L,D-transpeptidase family protein [Candidatus Sericytochromatia bacterium]
MRLIKKYGLSTMLISQFIFSSLSVNAEVAPSPSSEVYELKPIPVPTVIPTPEITSTPQNDIPESIAPSPLVTPKSINPSPIVTPTPINIKPTTNPSSIPTPKPLKVTPTPMPKVSPTNQPKNINPTPTATPKPQKINKIDKDKEQVKTSNPISIKNNPNSSFVLRPGKSSATTYTAKKGETLYTLSRKFNIRYRTLLSMNNTNSPYLTVGQKVIIDKSVKQTSNFNGIVVNIPEKRLYHFHNDQLQKIYTVSVGLPSPKWQTPIGDYKIREKVKDPVWKVPVSIQKEMAERGQVVKKEVPAGPGNPLGKWWMSLSGGLGIHSTNAPLSVGYSVSHGCIRMRPLSAAELWNKVAKNTPVKIIYQPVKLSIDDNNRIFIEVFRDIYGKTPDMTKYTKAMISDFALEQYVDWKKINYALRNKSGISTIISKIKV